LGLGNFRGEYSPSSFEREMTFPFWFLPGSLQLGGDLRFLEEAFFGGCTHSTSTSSSDGSFAQNVR